MAKDQKQTPGQAVKADTGQVRDVPFIGQARRPLYGQSGGYPTGAKVSTFDRHAPPAVTPGFAFTGRGFLPNLLNSHALVTLPEASSCMLENEGVHGREGMMPAAGSLSRLQAGQKLDEGAGGAGSFATVPAFGAKTNG